MKRKKLKAADIPITPDNATHLSKKAKEEILSQKDRMFSEYKRLSEEDFMVFCRGLHIASQTGPRVFENCMQTFQRVCFADIAPNLQAVRAGDMPAIRRFWIERTKKASKDADLGVMVLWLIAFPKRPFYGQIGAADRGQAAIVKERMSVLLHLNPWLNEKVELVNNEIRSKKKMANGKPMAHFDIMSSDVSGAHGGTPDVLIINELSHITKKEFAENLQSNAAGVAQGIMIIATNAGFRGTWQEVWKLNALRSNDWSVHCLAKPAPWTSRQTLKDEQKTLPPSKYKRLWRGRWASGKGDALQEEVIDGCFKLKGPLSAPERGWTYFGGEDLGITHDHAGVAIVGCHIGFQKIKLAFMEAWEPSVKVAGKTEVDLMLVEQRIVEIHKLFGTYQFGFDPHQASLMAQRLRKVNVPMREVPFVPHNLNRMASCLMQVLEQGILECYDDDDGRLRRDFGKLNIVEKAYGYKLEAVSDEFGHADVGTALLIALPMAVDFLAGCLDGLGPDDDLVDTNDGELTEEELQDMPDELRSIYGNEQEGMIPETDTRKMLPKSAPRNSKPVKMPKPSDPFEDME